MTQHAVFLDRDGTLIEHYDYLSKPEQVQLLTHTATALRRLKAHGYRLVLVTNQSAVARGIITERTLAEIHDRFNSLLAQENIYLDALYYCPYHPQGVVDKYKRSSDLRKPAPGMLQLAAKEHDLDLHQSWMVGDDIRDVEAGQRAGCRTILLNANHAHPQDPEQPQPDFRAVNLQEAANLIIHHTANHTPSAHQTTSPPTPEKSNPNKPPQQTATTPLPPPQKTSTPPSPANHAQQLPSTDNPLPAETASTPNEPDTPTGPQKTTASETSPLAEQVRHSEIERRKARLHRPKAKNTTPKARPGDKAASEKLLTQILRELKHLNRREAFSEFSIPKLIAGITQMLVLLCLILAFMFHAGENAKPDAVQNCLLLALTFQTMTLTLMLMHRQS